MGKLCQLKCLCLVPFAFGLTDCTHFQSFLGQPLIPHPFSNIYFIYFYRFGFFFHILPILLILNSPL